MKTKQLMRKPSRVFIDKEYLKLVPRPSDEQYESLKQSIKENGLLNPIIVGVEGKVIDGHTRFKICSELNIIPDFTVMKFKNLSEERLYVKTSNYKRRHLDDFQIVEDSKEELEKIREEIKKKNYQFKENSKDPNYAPRKDLPRAERSPFVEISKKIGVKPIKIEHCLRILNSGNKKLIFDVREKRKTVTEAVKKIEKKNSHLTRNRFAVKKIPANKIMKFCPVCGTDTLESWYDVVEIHCTNCNYYYLIKRRKH